MTKRLDETVRRRLRAGRLLLAGKTPAQAAHAVGVARQTVYTWKALLDEGGIDALRTMPPRGRPARLDDEQLQALGRALSRAFRLARRPRAIGSITRSRPGRGSPQAIASSAKKRYSARLGRLLANSRSSGTR